MKREYEINTMGHTWILDEYGKIDFFAYESGEYCNGPRCSKCGYGFCHHCKKIPSIKCKISK